MKKNQGKDSTAKVVDDGNVGGGFKVLRWKLPTSNLETEDEQDDSTCFQFFIKSHGIRETNRRKPKGRTLFVINIPPFLSEQNLKDLFLPFGEIGEIFLHQNPTIGLPESIDPYFPDEDKLIRGYKVGYIVFDDPKSVLDILERKDISPLQAENVCTGLEKWIKEYNNAIVPLSDLEENVKQYMMNFEKGEIQRIQEEKNNEGQPDEEGWVKVTRRGKRPGTLRTEKTEEKLKSKKRRFEKQLLNFTPTQIKETRAKELADLKRKFDEDKQRVALLRQNRKFKPF